MQDLQWADMTQKQKIQLVSVFAAVFSTAWGFAMHYSYQKKGSLSRGPMAVFFILTLTQIIIRLVSFQVWAYYLGFGMLPYASIGVFTHVVLMACLHFIFSDSIGQLNIEGTGGLETNLETAVRHTRRGKTFHLSNLC